MSTQLVVASTAFGLVTAIAALQDGLLPDASRRALVITNNAAIPEITDDLRSVAGIAALLDTFVAVHSLNEALEPQHPTTWNPRAEDVPSWQRYLRLLWQLGDDPVDLVVESVQADPTLAMLKVFTESSITVYSDGLMSYGPTRGHLPAQLGSRVVGLVHLDLVPGLQPLLLREFAVESKIISDPTFRSVVDRLGRPEQLGGPDGQTAVVLGQYLASAGILTAEEETELHATMIIGAVDAGFTKLIFKSHPSAPPQSGVALAELASSLGTQLIIRSDAELVETWFADPAIGLVVGCFSTGQVTAAHCFGVPAARVGTELLLERLEPFENSNRVPATLVDALLPNLADLSLERAGEGCLAPVAVRGAVDLQLLLDTVGYCMQPHRNPTLRDRAEQFLIEQPALGRRYVKRRRVTRLDLPGAPPPKVQVDRPHALTGRIPGWLRRAARELLGANLSRRLARRVNSLSPRRVPTTR